MLIKHIPNIFEKEGRAEYPDVEWQAGKTLKAYCREVIGRKRNYRAIVNGGAVDFDYKPLQADEIIFTPDVNDMGSIISGVVGAVITVAGVYVPGAQFLVPIGISMMAGAVVSAAAAALFTPELPSGDMGGFKDSKTYSWNGIQNLSGEGNVMPVVLGRHRVGGAILERFVESHDDKDELSVLIGLSEGPVLDIDVSSVRFNSQPVDLFENVVSGPFVRYGSWGQTPIPNFTEIKHYYGMTSNVELAYDIPYEYKVNNNAASKITFHLRFQGLVYVENDGDLREHYDEFAIETSGDGSIWTAVDAFTVTRTTKSPFSYDRVVSYAPVNPGYDRFVRIRQTTYWEESNPKIISTPYLKAVTETEDAAVAYKRTALIGMKLKASELANGQLPAISTIVEGVQIADVRTGTTDLASIQNPANIIYEILTNERWGAGKLISDDQIDLASLQAFADWCDEPIDYDERALSPSLNWWEVTNSQKRYEINLVIDQEYRVVDLIEKICSCCRAIPYWAGNKFKIVVDRPQASFAQTFTMGNIIEGSFEEEYTGVEVPNQLEAEFLDEEDDFNKKLIVAIDKDRATEAVKSKRINVFGLTNRARVKRELVFAMRKMKAHCNRIQFNASIDGVICEVGDLIRFQHDVPQYGFGGRVIGVNGTDIALDQAVPLQAGITSTLRVRRQDDNSYYVDDTLTTDTDQSVESLYLSSSAHGIKVGDVWTFGPNGLDFRPYRILSITKSSDQEIAIEAENYNPAVHDETANIVVYENKYSLLGLTTEFDIDGGISYPTPVYVGPVPPGNPLVVPPYVTNLNLTESRRLAGNVWIPYIIVSFEPVSMPANSDVYVQKYEVLYSQDGIHWQSAGFTSGTTLNINDVKVGESYFVVVKPYTNSGTSNNIETSSYRLNYNITLVGNILAPLVPSGLTATPGTLSVILEWTNPSIPDLDYISIWCAQGVNDRAAAVEIFRTKGEKYVHSSLTFGVSYYYWIMAVDSDGNESPWHPVDALGGVAAAASTDPGPVLDLLNKSITESELVQSVVDKLNTVSDDTRLTAAEADIDQAQLDIDAAEADLLAIEGRVTTAETDIIQNSDEIILRATQLDLDAVEGRVTTAETNITQNSSAITLKADQTEVDTLSGTVSSHTTSIAANSDAIVLKADQTEVDTLSSTVSSNSTSISTNADAITLKASQTEVDTISGDVNTLQSEMALTTSQWTVKIDANGHMAGVGLMLDPLTSASQFIVLTDQFAIVQPNGSGTPKTPFVVGTIGGVTGVGIDGDMLIDGTIYGKSIVLTDVDATALLNGPAQAGADKTGSNTAYDTARVNGYSASTVQSRAYTGYYHSNSTHAPSNADRTADNIAKAILNLPDSPGGSAGLYADGSHLGYHNGSTFLSMISYNSYGGILFAGTGTGSYDEFILYDPSIGVAIQTSQSDGITIRSGGGIIVEDGGAINVNGVLTVSGTNDWWGNSALLEFVGGGERFVLVNSGTDFAIVDDYKNSRSLHLGTSSYPWSKVLVNGFPVGKSGYGEIGTYVFGWRSVKFYQNSTCYGSAIDPASVANSNNIGDDDYRAVNLTKGGSALSGTWRAMGRNNTSQVYGASLFLRIA